MNRVFGIDLGTTYSCIAYVDDFGKSVVIKNVEGANTTPSVVYFESLENIIVGEEAKNMLVAEPESTIAFVKRSMGKDDENGNPERFEFHGKLLSPEEISSKILKKLVKDANDELKNNGVIGNDETIKDVVITCPAYFGMREKAATKTAGELAGLNVIDIINEPTAAAINYGLLKKESKKNVMVYDLGGGTFDVTIIQIDGGNINVVYSDGDRNLGGKDWDQTVADYLAEEFEKATGIDFYSDEESANDIILIAEKAKKSLSSKTSTKVTLNAGGKRQTIELTREKFNDLTSNLLQSTIYKVDQCLQYASQGEYHISLQDLDEILLVGGSSKMPQIEEALKGKYSKPISLFDPDEAVAKGAASYAQVRQNYKLMISEIAKQTGSSVEAIEAKAEKDNRSISDLAKEAKVDISDIGLASLGGGALGVTTTVKISDSLSRTYGQKVIDDVATMHLCISNILMKGTKLPAEREEKSYTLREGQTGCNISIYESESDKKTMEVDEAKLLGEAVLDFGKPLPKETEIITKLKMSNAGLLHMVATEASTNSIVEADFVPSGGLSDSELMAATSRSKAEDVN